MVRSHIRSTKNLEVVLLSQDCVHSVVLWLKCSLLQAPRLVGGLDVAADTMEPSTKGFEQLA